MLSWEGVLVEHRITQLSKSISQSKTHFSATHENQFTFFLCFVLLFFDSAPFLSRLLPQLVCRVGSF